MRVIDSYEKIRVAFVALRHRNCGLILALSLNVTWLLAAVADTLLALGRWTLAGDVANLTAVVAFLSATLSAVLAVVAVPAA